MNIKNLLKATGQHISIPTPFNQLSNSGCLGGQGLWQKWQRPWRNALPRLFFLFLTGYIEVEKRQLLSFNQASTYGKCIVADYNAVYKDKCLTEFLRLKDCYLVSCSVEVPKSADLCQRLLRRPHSVQVARKKLKACRLELCHEM